MWKLTNGKDALSVKAVKLLEKVKANILEEPRRFIMDNFGNRVDPDDTVFDGDVWTGNAAQKAPPCGTTACIAGWAALLGTPRTQLGFNPFKAKFDNEQARLFSRAMGNADKTTQKLLGISNEEGEVLFYVNGWPRKFQDRYRNSRTARQRARIAVNRIDHFIKYRE